MIVKTDEGDLEISDAASARLSAECRERERERIARLLETEWLDDVADTTNLAEAIRSLKDK